METVEVEIRDGSFSVTKRGKYDEQHHFVSVTNWANFRPFKSHYMVLDPRHFVSSRVRGRLIRRIAVDNVSLCSIAPPDSGGVLPPATDTVAAIRLLGQEKLWRTLGGRALDTVELLIYLAAGYGVLRWAEITLIRIFAPGQAEVPP